MSGSTKLLVPMSVEALVLKQPKEGCVDLSPQLQDYDQSILGEELQPKITNTITLEKGVHLHWTLPKALKHAFVTYKEDQGTTNTESVEENKDETEFPYVPNRWLITRLQTNKGLDPIPAKFWIVESDAIAEDEIPNWVEVNDNTLEFKSIGRSKTWTTDYADETVLKPTLTAVGATNPLFASFYPECKNVFGFHDPMDDVPKDKNNTFTYNITGWYSDETLDPLRPLEFSGEGKTAQQKKRKREYEWFKKQWQCHAKQYPTASILHASINCVEWSKTIVDGVPKGEIQVFAGNTAIEALSAQIAKGINQGSKDNKENVEQLLNALQYQMLDDDSNEPSIDKIKIETHKRSFTPKTRDHIWEIVRIEDKQEQLEKNEEDNAHFPNDTALLKDYITLNEAQIKRNTAVEELERYQQEHYFLWYKQALKTVKQYNLPDFDYATYRQETLTIITSKREAIKELEEEINQIKNRIWQYKYIQNPFDSTANPEAEFELKAKLEDRFYEPNDPVILLCGTGIGNTKKPNFNTGNKSIVCRTIHEVLNTLQFKVPTQNNPISVDISTAIFNIRDIDKLSHNKIPYTIISKLIEETLLLDSALAIDIALLCYEGAGLDGDKTSPRIQRYANTTVKKMQEKPIVKTKESRAPESFSILKWQQAWSPLFMVWEVDYSPSSADIKTLDLTKKTKDWELKEYLLFKNKSTLKETSTSVTHTGISPFSNSVFSNLKETIPDEIVNKYGELNLIAQSLSGLNKHLLMQKPGVQLPPFIYEEHRRLGFDSDYIINSKELEDIGEEGYVFGCNPGIVDGSGDNLFHPLRAGLIKIVNLSIVDAFGQSQKIIISETDNNPNVTCSVSIQGATLDLKHVVPLPPRIVQPSRLQFYWLNEEDNIIYQDTEALENPVIGWFVPNYLDNNIMVYDGGGNEVVILQIIADATQKNGYLLNKRPFPGTKNVSKVSNSLQLNKLLKAIDSGSIASGIMDLANKINTNLAKTNPLQKNNSALFCGQPIAIARCSVELELLGTPAFNQRWDQSGKDNTGAIETVKFPLHLGNYTIDKDGLLGYFIENDYSHCNTTVNVPEFQFSESETFFKANTVVPLTLNKKPTKLTVLLDPSAGIHLLTGILPTKYVELFHNSSKAILETLNTSFMMAPFIADKVSPGIPTPRSMNTNWKWIHKPDVNTWQTDKDIEEGKNKEQSNFKKQQIYEGWIRLSDLKTDK